MTKPLAENGARLVRPALVVFVLLLSACTGSGVVPAHVGGTSTAAEIRQMGSIATLRDAFNADAGATRLVLIVSPT